ncbi:hypothetical protein [Streptomyces tsukubensis]|uniref:hypothetical protein n=1 Tax=Streptomyces tsukubensis TaxID=83656 RepID=UPI0034509FFA
MDPTAALIVLAVAAKACTLLALWIRLHARTRREQQRQQYLLHVTRAVSADGGAEFDDQVTGHHLHMKITRPQAAQEDRAA